ncbi:hypothetical protein V3C99_015356 [Haemonchus contortus]
MPNFQSSLECRGLLLQAIGRIKAREGPTKRASTGRPRITTNADDRKIICASRQDHRRTSSDNMTEISTTVTPLPSQSTISRRLRDAGLHGRRPVKKPLASPKNRELDLTGRMHLHWTLDQWREVIWSDESKFDLFGTDGISFVRRPVNKRFDPEYQIPSVKHGGVRLGMFFKSMYGATELYSHHYGSADIRRHFGEMHATFCP